MRKAWPGLALVVAALIFFHPVLEHDYIWDDPQYVVENETLRSFDGLVRIWSEPGATPQYYPLVFTMFWVEYQIFGLDYTVFHLINVLLHAAGAVLLWLLMRRLGVPGAWFVALFFVVHPVHVESVAWITERKNVLSGFFYLGAALAYVRFALPRVENAERQKEAAAAAGTASEPHRGAAKWYALALVLFLCALLSKTVTSTLPAAILLVIWWKRGRIAWQNLLALIPFFLLGIGFGLMTVWMEKFHVGALGDEWSLTFKEHILLAGRIPWFYAAKLVWPLNLVFIYPRWDIDAAVWWQYLFPIGLVVTLVALWLLRRRIGRGPLTAALFFVGTLVPALGFFNVYPMRFSFVADHFQYLASIGPIALLVAAAALVFRSLRSDRHPLMFACLPVIACLLGLATIRQLPAYENRITLWNHTLERNPDAWIAHNNLGEILVAKGQSERAITHLEAALRLKPGLKEALGNLANARYKLGHVDEAIERYGELLRIDPGNAVAYCNLGIILAGEGRHAEAAEHHAEAVRLAPEYAKARFCLARALDRQDRHEEAVTHMREAARLDHESAEVRFELAKLLAENGDIAGAIQALRDTLDLRPDHAEAANTMAWHLATRKDATTVDIAEAATLAEQFSRQVGDRNPQLLDTLAAARARAGRFDEAVTAAEKALELAKAGGMWELAVAIEDRIGLYRRKQPFIAP